MHDPKLDLVLERVLDVPPETVCRAWTEPRLIEKWFCPRPWMAAECEIDLRPGGTFHTVLPGPDGTTLDNPACYLEVVPNRRLVFTTAFGPGYRRSRRSSRWSRSARERGTMCSPATRTRRLRSSTWRWDFTRDGSEAGGPARRDGEHRVAGALKPDVTKVWSPYSSEPSAA
jgi:uncharacterized protein YndB with AHSA1/START domain